MLTVEERRIAVRAVALAISNAEYPRSVLVTWITEPDFRLFFSTIPQNPMALAEEAVRMCEDSQWGHVPPWLQQILSRVAQTTDVSKILAKIQTPPSNWRPPAAPGNPFDALWLPRPGLPFINRLNLREFLRRLSEPTGPSVLIINGLAKSGKSYSVELLKHALQESMSPGSANSSVPICLIELEPGMGASLSPEALARMIMSRIKTHPTPMPDTSDNNVTLDRTNERLCDWLMENAVATGQQWWVVLDKLDDPDLTPLTRNFISKMVELLSNGKHNKKLRLVIIDYPPQLIASAPPGMVEVEQLAPIGEVDLKWFLEKEFERFGGAPPTPAAVRAGVILALLNLPKDDSRLKTLNERLKMLIENLIKETGHA